MAERVHPHDSPPASAEHKMTSPQNSAASAKPPSPSPGTYVIKIPKDQVYRVPPPENARRYENYTRRSKRSRSRCCCCFCWLIGIFLLLLVLLAIAAGVLYLVFRPKSPKYSIDAIAIRGINITSPSSTAWISPEFDVTVRSENPNDKIGIRYERDSSADIFYNGVKLSNGMLPAFYQPSNNVTVFETALRGNDIELTRSDRKAMEEAQTKRKVPLTVKLRAPVKIKVGSVETLKITVKVDCDITVNQLTPKAKIVSKDCSYKVNLW